MQLWLLMLTAFITSSAYVGASFIKSRTWHEEFVSHRLGGNQRVLYPRYKVCRAPREKPEKIKHGFDLNQRTHERTVEITWANLLAAYTADSGAEIYNWDFWKNKTNEEKATRFEQFTSILIFLGAFVTVFTISIITVPTIGCVGFKFYSLIWYVIFHPEIRRILRRMYITKEKLSRKHMKLLMPYAKGATGVTKKQFRLPFILREYNEEEVPAELMQSEEDTDGEISSDGFENLLINKKGDQTMEETKALVELMASTEAEMENEMENDPRNRKHSTASSVTTHNRSIFQRFVADA